MSLKRRSYKIKAYIKNRKHKEKSVSTTGSCKMGVDKAQKILSRKKKRMSSLKWFLRLKKRKSLVEI